MGKKTLKRLEKVEIIENLLNRLNLDVKVTVKSKRVLTEIKREHYSIFYSIDKQAFIEMYYELPAWIVTKFYSSDDIKYIINNSAY